MKSILHTICGGKLGKYDDDTLTSISVLAADKFIRADGSSPDAGDKLKEKCPVCGRRIDSWNEMEIGIDRVKNVWS